MGIQPGDDANFFFIIIHCMGKKNIGSIFILSPTRTGDYHNLEPKKPKDTTTGTGPPEPVILTECFKLPLSSNYLGVFLGAGGKHIKPLCNQYKVQMHLGEESVSESSSQGGGRKRGGRGKQYIHLSGDAIKVTVCSKPEDKPDVKRFKEELVKRAEIVTKSREKHQENVSFILFIACNSNIPLFLSANVLRLLPSLRYYRSAGKSVHRFNH